MEMNNSLFIIHKLKKELFCNEEFIKDSLQVSDLEFSDILNNNKLKQREIQLLSDFLSINIDDLIYNRVNWNIVREKFSDKTKEIDDSYTIGAGTYISHIRAIFQCVSNGYNEKTAKNVMDNFGLNKEILRDDSRMVNINLPREILEYLNNESLIDEVDLSRMALMCLTGKADILASLRTQHLSGREIAKFITTNSDKYEKNFSYTFEDIESNVYKIKSQSRDEVNELFGKAALSSELLNQWKKEIINHTALMANGSGIQIMAIENRETKTSQQTDFIIKDNLSYFFH